MNRLPTFDFLKWFYPGMHIKRWLALITIGVAMMTFGLSYVVREAYLEGLTAAGLHVLHDPPVHPTLHSRRHVHE